MAKPFRRMLLTNDDGFDAPGIRILEEVVRELCDEVWVVAPDNDQSGTSHSLSLHSPLRVSTKGERRCSVSGTPGDCVVMAVRHLMQEPPELILSGINRGANLGVETVFSGTVGAAMTGLLLGIPSIALSQAFSTRENVRWETARAFAGDVILKVTGHNWGDGACLNVNFPDVPPDAVRNMVLTSQGEGYLDDVRVVPATDPRKLDYYWLSLHRRACEDAAGTETSVLRDGNISVTPLQFERTSSIILNRLRADRLLAESLSEQGS